MPTYEYCCPNCLKHKDVRHGADKHPEVRCDKCKHDMVKQLGTFSSFNFRGTGFFRNDYPKGK